jgi:hypothetical protein
MWSGWASQNRLPKEEVATPSREPRHRRPSGAPHPHHLSLTSLFLSTPLPSHLRHCDAGSSGCCRRSTTPRSPVMPISCAMRLRV